MVEPESIEALMQVAACQLHCLQPQGVLINTVGFLV